MIIECGDHHSRLVIVQDRDREIILTAGEIGAVVNTSGNGNIVQVIFRIGRSHVVDLNPEALIVFAECSFIVIIIYGNQRQRLGATPVSAGRSKGQGMLETADSAQSQIQPGHVVAAAQGNRQVVNTGGVVAVIGFRHQDHTDGRIVSIFRGGIVTVHQGEFDHRGIIVFRKESQVVDAAAMGRNTADGSIFGIIAHHPADISQKTLVVRTRTSLIHIIIPCIDHHRLGARPVVRRIVKAQIVRNETDSQTSSGSVVIRKEQADVICGLAVQAHGKAS